MTAPSSLFEALSRSLTAALVCLLGTLLSLAPHEAQAGTTVSLYTSFSGNINFVTAGGTFRTASNGVNPCSVGTTSNATVAGIPASSTIVAAYLYYAASGNTVDNTVTLGATNLTADRTFTDTTVVPWFSGFKDVTAQVTGNGTYTLSNLTISTGTPWSGNSTCLGAWALVVIYSNNTTETNRVINVYDGFQEFQNSSITLNPSNFQVPNTGINGKFAVITWEGDPDISTGTLTETLQFNGNTLSDACNINTNQYNSTINTQICTGTAATDDVFYGLDLDTYDVTSYLTAGDTAATTFYQTGQDAVMLSAQIISISNTPVSDLAITNSDGAASVNAGSNTTYTLTVTNNGSAATSGTTTVTDVLPTGETFVSASGTGWTCGNASGTVTCTRSNSLASSASYPAISLTVTVGSLASSPIANTASVSGGNFDNLSTNNSATDSDTVNYPAADLAISKSAVGTFTAGTPVSYTLTVTNNGPNAVPSGATTTVSDTLPATLTYISASGTGWTCGAVGQVVTCTSTSAVSSGSSLPTITLTALLSSSVAANVVNTATVSNAFITDGTSGNDSSTSTVTNASISKPNYSTSTKTWVDLNGGDAAPGDTIEYTITVKDSAGAAGTNVEVTDDLPAQISSFSVISIPGGSTNNSTGTGTGANGTGYLDITGISVPASGTATVVVDVVLKGTLVTGDTVDNTATVVGGTVAATPAASTLTVNQSLIGSSGNKVLYVYDDTAGANTRKLSRTPISATSTTVVTIAGGATADFTLTPVIATTKTLTLPAQTVTVVLRAAATGTNTGTNRPTTVELRKASGTTIATSASQNVANGVATHTYTIAIAATTINAGDALVLRFHNNSGTASRNVTIAQKTTASACTQTGGTSTCSTVTFNTSTVINVDSINVYSVAYSGTTTQSIWEPNAVIYIRAVVSDPFGCDDVFPSGGTAPKLTLTDPSSTVILNAVTMTEPAADATACTTTPTSPTKTFEYYVSGTTGYTISDTAVEGFWTPSVTATEGAEATVTHTANGSFELRRPSLTIVKSVSVISDPLGSVKPRAMSGSVSQYSVVVSNGGKGRANGVSISDAIPTNTTYVIGSPSFTDGSTSSGLSAPTYTFFSNAGCTTSYSPTGGAGTLDANVKCIKATFTAGTFMNGKTGASSPSFTLTFRVQVN